MHSHNCITTSSLGSRYGWHQRLIRTTQIQLLREIAKKNWNVHGAWLDGASKNLVACTAVKIIAACRIELKTRSWRTWCVCVDVYECSVCSSNSYDTSRSLNVTCMSLSKERKNTTYNSSAQRHSRSQRQAAHSSPYSEHNKLQRKLRNVTAEHKHLRNCKRILRC